MVLLNRGWMSLSVPTHSHGFNEVADRIAIYLFVVVAPPACFLKRQGYDFINSKQGAEL